MWLLLLAAAVGGSAELPSTQSGRPSGANVEAAERSGSAGKLRGRLERLRSSQPTPEALVRLHELYTDALRSGKRGSQLLGEVLLELDRFGEKASEFARMSDGRVRRAAAWALGVTASRGAAEALKALLADERETVRRSAVDGLAQLATREAISALKTAMEDESENVRLGSLKTLEALDPGWVAQEIAGFSKDASEEVAGEALRFAARNWAECSDEPGLIQAAAASLGRLPEAEAVLALAGKDATEAAVGALGSGSVEAAEAATRVLAKIGAGEATEELARAIREGEGPLARTAAEALGELGGEAALMGLAREGGNAAERAISGLGHARRSDELVKFLVSFLERRGELARTAARSLAALDAREALPELAQMAESEDLSDAIQAVRAMTAMGDRSKLGALLSRLSSQDEWVVLRAAAALARLGNVCGLPALINALGSEDGMMRAYASTVLAGTVDSGVEFPIDGPPGRREKLARMWRIWWEAHKRTLELGGEE